jgi:16S rRNA U516 pseudouridylate synthase RsuA-like enzyme
VEGASPTRVPLFILIKMTDAQLVSRRARVQQLIADGRVMTDSMRKKQKEVAKYQEKLETLAGRILSGLL